jgi:RimJ/RimL family protein N-acetyltransferase
MIEAARLVLRLSCDEDMARFAAIINRPARQRQVGGVVLQPARDGLVDKQIADFADDRTCYGAVMLRETGAFIGRAGLRRADDERGRPVTEMLEAGWRIAEAPRGKGCAQRAMRAANDWVWPRRRDDRMATSTGPDNLPSQPVLRRRGSGEDCQVDVLARPVVPLDTA